MSGFLWIAIHGGNLPVNIDSTGRHTGNIILLAPFKGSREGLLQLKVFQICNLFTEFLNAM